MLVLGVLLGRGRRRGHRVVRRPPGTLRRRSRPGGAAAGVPASDAAAAERATLVTAAIAATTWPRTRVCGAAHPSPRAGWRHPGCARYGAPFDPQHHHAVDRLPTHDPAQHNTVMTDRPGWVDGGRVLRLPDVIVYRNE